MGVPLVYFDTETTGLTTWWNEVIEIGATVADPKTLLPTNRIFERKLKIEHPERVSPGCLGVYNHYKQEVWDREAVSQVQGWTDFSSFLFEVGGGGQYNPVLIIKNAKFDYSLATFWCTQLGIKLNASHSTHDLDTAFMCFRLRNGFDIKNNKLDAMCQLMGVDQPQAHSAMVDAFTAGICNALVEMYMNILIDIGRGYTHQEYLMESWSRLGKSKPGWVPLVSKRTALPS